MPPPSASPLAAGRLTAIFSKRPVPGRVKTRLTPPLEPVQAARLAEGMLADAVARCTAAATFRTALLFTPAADEAWFRERFPALADQRPQRGATLAERLAAFFDEALGAEGVRTAVAIGSDQPTVTTARIGEAHGALEAGADLVLGPDRGGGYYLIGLRRAVPELFTEVEMSTAGMCAATVDVAQRLGLDVVLLEPGYDVDVEADLRLLRLDLERLLFEGVHHTPEYPHHTAARLAEIDSNTVSHQKPPPQ